MFPFNYKLLRQHDKMSLLLSPQRALATQLRTDLLSRRVPGKKDYWLRPRLKIALSCLGLSLFWQEKFVSAVVKEIKFKNYFCSMKIVWVEKKFSSKSGSVEQLYRKSYFGECLLLYKKKPGKLTLGIG